MRRCKRTSRKSRTKATKYSKARENNNIWIGIKLTFVCIGRATRNRFTNGAQIRDPWIVKKYFAFSLLRLIVSGYDSHMPKQLIACAKLWSVLMRIVHNHNFARYSYQELINVSYNRHPVNQSSMMVMKISSSVITVFKDKCPPTPR